MTPSPGVEPGSHSAKPAEPIVLYITLTYLSYAGPSDVWFGGNSGFGGNGEQPAPRCVTDGPFRRGTWNVVPSAGNGCLRREFNLTENAPDSGAVAALLRIEPATFDDFEITIRINLHDPVHCLIGGTLSMLCSLRIQTN